jgi:hypothetical protein
MATNDFLQAERRERPRVAIVAGAAALLTLAGQLVPQLLIGGDRPDNALGSALLQDEHRPAVVLGGVLSMLGLLAVTYVLDFLLRATGRRTAVPPFARPLVIVGGVAVALFTCALAIVTAIRVDEFATDSSLTYEEVRAISDVGPAIVIGIVGQLALAVGMLLAALQAMRSGLLTRFLGILGAISAVLFVFPLLGLPIVQAYWLLMLALLLWNVGGAREPPAWQSGEAVPWPSSAELRDQRVRDVEARRGGAGGEVDAVTVESGDDADDNAEAEAALGGGESGGQRRKRKKRR